MSLRKDNQTEFYKVMQGAAPIDVERAMTLLLTHTGQYSLWYYLSDLLKILIDNHRKSATPFVEEKHIEYIFRLGRDPIWIDSKGSESSLKYLIYKGNFSATLALLMLRSSAVCRTKVNTTNSDGKTLLYLLLEDNLNGKHDAAIKELIEKYKPRFDINEYAKKCNNIHTAFEGFEKNTKADPEVFIVSIAIEFIRLGGNLATFDAKIKNQILSAIEILPDKSKLACLKATRDKDSELGKIFFHAPFDQVNGISSDDWENNKKLINRINKSFKSLCPNQSKQLHDLITVHFSHDFEIDFNWQLAVDLVREGADVNLVVNKERKKLPTLEFISTENLNQLLAWGLDPALDHSLIYRKKRIDYALLFIQYATSSYAKYSDVLMAGFRDLVESTDENSSANKKKFIPIYLRYIDVFSKDYQYDFAAIASWLLNADASELIDKTILHLKPHKEQLFKAILKMSEADQWRAVKQIIEGKETTALGRVFWCGFSPAITKGHMAKVYARYLELSPTTKLKALLDVYPLDIEAAMQLVRDGALPGVQGMYLRTLLHLLVLRAYDDIAVNAVKELIAKFPALIDIKNYSNETPYDSLLKLDDIAHANLAMEFVRSGVSSNTRSQSASSHSIDSLMHSLICIGLREGASLVEEHIKELVNKHQANIHILDKKNRTPLQRCLSGSSYRADVSITAQIISLLLSLGADPITKNERLNLLEWLVGANWDNKYDTVIEETFEHCRKVTDIEAYAKQLFTEASGKTRIKLAILFVHLGVNPAIFDIQLILPEFKNNSIDYYKRLDYLKMARNPTTELGKIFLPTTNTVDQRVKNRLTMKVLWEACGFVHDWDLQKGLYCLMQEYFEAGLSANNFSWDKALAFVKSGADVNYKVHFSAQLKSKMELESATLMHVLKYSFLNETPPPPAIVKELLELGLDLPGDVIPMRFLVDKGLFEYAVLFIQFGADGCYGLGIGNGLGIFYREMKLSVLDALLVKIGSNPVTPNDSALITELLTCNVPITIKDDPRIFSALLNWLDQISADVLTPEMLNHLKLFKDQLLLAMSKLPDQELRLLRKIFKEEGDTALKSVFFAGHTNINEDRLGKARTRYLELEAPTQSFFAVERQPTLFGRVLSAVKPGPEKKVTLGEDSTVSGNGNETVQRYRDSLL